jgi:hypothetical protein
VKKKIAIAKKINKGDDPTIFFNYDGGFFTHPLTYKYEMVSKLRLYKLAHLQCKRSHYAKLCDFTIPAHVRELEKMLYDELMQARFTCITVKNLMQRPMNELQYLNKLGLFSEEEVEKYRAEVQAFMAHMIQDTERGKNEYGIDFTLYLSNREFVTNCAHFSCKGFETMIVQLFGFNLYLFEDERCTADMKNWASSLIKSAEIISLSNEQKRFDFFQKQAELIAAF